MIKRLKGLIEMYYISIDSLLELGTAVENLFHKILSRSYVSYLLITMQIKSIDNYLCDEILY